MFFSDAFRRIAAELAATDATAGSDQPWILFADIATTVANPLYRLEDLLRYTTTITAQPKKLFYGQDGSYSPPGESSPSAATNSTTNTTSTVQVTSPSPALSSKCHMIGQLSPTSISANMLLFPVTTTAHRILLDWSLAMQRMPTHAGPWHSSQVQLESVVLSHLHNVLEKEYNNATDGYRRLQSAAAVASADHHRCLPAKARIRTTKAVHPTQLHHVTKREYKTKQAIKGELLKLQFHQRQQRQQEQQRRDKDAAEASDEGGGDRAVDQANDLLLVDGAGQEFNLWSLVFGNRNQKAAARQQHAAKSTPKHPPVSNTFQGLPHGLCIRMRSDVGREQCFGRTMRAFSLFWDTDRVTPFCLLAGHTPMGVFNTADWPMEPRSGVVTAGPQPQYTTTVAAAKLRLSAVPGACRRISPPFYAGKNATVIQAIPLWSEMTPAHRTALHEQYEHGLRETERRDRQRVSPRATIATRTECDVFWSSYLVRHVDAWEEEQGSASPQRLNPQPHHQRASNGPARPKAPPKQSPARSKGRSFGH